VLNRLPIDEATRKRAVQYLLRHRLAFTIEDSEDAVQAACVCALSTRYPWTGKSKFSSWFTRIAINCALMARRPHGTVHRTVPINEEICGAAKPRNTDILQRDRLRIAITNLSVMHQGLIFDYFYLGMTLGEISLARDISRCTIKDRLFKARRKLGQELAATRAA
jgi:RNA polymerase sigma-70 factor (ECF subfamily)